MESVNIKRRFISNLGSHSKQSTAVCRRQNVEVRIGENVEVETPLTGQTAAVLPPSDDSNQECDIASMSRPTGPSDFDSQLLKAELCLSQMKPTKAL